ncbi:NUDIX hydrolase domain-like protein [Gorgonomyces haynaldii]|nr:NUDIX hydrolase domain-like protein [Gorgonomyces haynaldii]
MGYDPEQVRLMQEECILVSDKDEIIGSASKKECHLMTNIEKGMLHRAFSCFIFTDGKLLLQQRSWEKITFPGYFTNTCCSHPLVGEEGLDGCKRAVVRKLEHELGIKTVKEEELQFLTKIHYLAPSDGLWGEHEIDYIFIYQGNVNVIPNTNEICSYKYVTMDELKDMFALAAKGEIKMTPWFQLIVENYLYQWWEQLDALDKMQDDQVHKL